MVTTHVVYCGSLHGKVTYCYSLLKANIPVIPTLTMIVNLLYTTDNNA